MLLIDGLSEFRIAALALRRHPRTQDDDTQDAGYDRS
jgi:hypothetical protein